ncbi:reverse transcriptase domain-containing protein [Trichonephila clavata]|uniref:Reverse transcriptase domain-containing protein n=1 Tax=Trichonephila clavata TaxID=2740835 RepID=A0A8X6L1K9_TRICU|nr:reverse transcriptase domain-containing protein [Trichonephila clavata]
MWDKAYDFMKTSFEKISDALSTNIVFGGLLNKIEEKTGIPGSFIITVGGGAASAIKGLELKFENYNSALEILHSCYGNKDVLVQAHLGSLLNITPIKTSNDLNALRTMYDKIETRFRNLESLSVDRKTYANLLTPIIIKLLPSDLALDFTRKTVDENWPLQALLDFFRKELLCKVRAKFIYSERKNRRENLNYYRENSSATELLANSQKPNYHSRKVRNSKGGSRYDFNQSSPLNKRRDAGNESSVYFKKSHNQAFCFDYHKSVNLEKKEGSDTVVSNVAHNNSEIYLQSGAGQLIGRKGSSLIRRIIFDGGSQRTFLESKLARELNLPVVGQEMLTVHTFQSERPTKHVYSKVRIRVKSLISNKEIEIKALETKQISSAHINTGACEIGLLVGSDNYWKCIGNRIERLDESLVAVGTTFGFCIHGSVSEDKDNDEASVNLVVSKELISDQLNRLWQLENLGIEVEEVIKDISENKTLKSFESSIEYSGNRYKVGLPWKPEMKHLLDDNSSVALNRHSKLVKRFNMDKLLFKDYKKIIDDYAKENIVESMIETLKLQGSHPTFYLPHTCVKRLDKTTTKIRIVFDGSSHGENQLSLNDCFNSGVNLNPDLLELILKFRENPIAYAADIEKAFLQIELHEQDRDVVRFFWTENLNDYDPKNLQVYRLTRVLFGLTSSPFMLAATIRYHLKKYKDKFPDTAKIVESSLYVDDFISGQENVDKALQTSLESIEIFKESGMSLRKWHTNSKKLEIFWV